MINKSRSRYCSPSVPPHSSLPTLTHPEDKQDSRRIYSGCAERQSLVLSSGSLVSAPIPPLWALQHVEHGHRCLPAYPPISPSSPRFTALLQLHPPSHASSQRVAILNALDHGNRAPSRPRFTSLCTTPMNGLRVIGPAPPPPLFLANAHQKRAVNEMEIHQHVAYYTISTTWWPLLGGRGTSPSRFPHSVSYSRSKPASALFVLPYTTQFSFIEPPIVSPPFVYHFQLILAPSSSSVDGIRHVPVILQFRTSQVGRRGARDRHGDEKEGPEGTPPEWHRLQCCPSWHHREGGQEVRGREEVSFGQRSLPRS